MKLVGEPTEVQGLITCRYHCWAYATNGDLKATPHVGGVDQHHSVGFDNATHGLKPVRSAVFMGVLFVNLSGDAPEFEQHAGELMRRAEQLLGTGGWPEREAHYCSLGVDFAGQGSLAYRGSDIAGAPLPRLEAWPAD